MPDSEPPAPRKRRILIVDDQPGVVMSLSYLLSAEFGYDVVTASNGPAGLEIAIKGDVDLMLLDFDMPHFTGYDVLRALSTESLLSKIPVVMITGRATKEVRQGSMAAGAREVVSKPFDIHSLKNTILRHLAPETN
jgi:CheY-like chemotaxis protein